MCGINAVIGGTHRDLSLMMDAASRRGIIRDVTEYKNALVCFDWLPITDATAKKQPFTSGKVVCFMNGYISNYRELAEEYCFDLRTNCDTELLAMFLDEFNGERLEELNGFFSVLYHDGMKWRAFTDRYGTKQLYWKECNGVTYISSEVKTILNASPSTINPYALDTYRHTLGVMNAHTVYDDILRVRRIDMPVIEQQDIPYDEARDILDELMDMSIHRNKTHLTDCVFLSGGIDSGIIAKRINPEYCFSMDYTDPKYSEIERIKLNSTGKHITLMCNDHMEKYKTLVPEIIDDPRAGSCYTNIAITQLASEFCTVVYSGAGGDEFFGGYPHRLNRPIAEVIKRTSFDIKRNYDINHYEYDLRFLAAVLTVEDRIGGYHTMETRYPLLDNDLVNFSLSLPYEYKENKRILKDISGLHPMVIDGPKKGFSNPHFSNDQWVDFTVNYLENVQNGVDKY